MAAEEGAAMPLAGGLMLGYQCGQPWGATLAAGAESYRRFGETPLAEAKGVIAGQKIIEAFQARARHINCRDITNVCWARPGQVVKYLVTGGIIKCFGMAANFAPEAYQAIDAALSVGPINVPSRPISCAAEVLRQSGASGMHQVMAAGFAGGIGLSGEACGALGAAIWKMAMDESRQGTRNKVIMAKTKDLIDAFLKVSNDVFECAGIVGRNFNSVAEHAGYLHGGGCRRIIETLAATVAERHLGSS
jgi:hypothetical protein